MLREIVTGQAAREPRRRWFSNDDFDLVVWFDDVGGITGFQLCYDRSRVERALTWTATDGYRHFRVDAGEATPLKNLTPILTSGGEFARDRVIAGFVEAADGIDPTIRSFVIQRLQEVAPCAQR